MNDWVCKRCKISGHKSYDCPMTTADTDDASQNEAEQSVAEIEADRQPQPQATCSVERAGNQPAAPVASPKKTRTKSKDKQKSSSTALKRIQEYIASSQTPKKAGDKKKRSERHSPPTPNDDLQA